MFRLQIGSKLYAVGHAGLSMKWVTAGTMTR